METDRPAEVGTTDLRKELADVLNKAVYGEITLVTSRGRPIAGIVPAPDAERLWRERQRQRSNETRHDDRPRSSA
jgi:prevent-host-death family protein